MMENSRGKWKIFLVCRMWFLYAIFRRIYRSVGKKRCNCEYCSIVLWYAVELGFTPEVNRVFKTFVYNNIAIIGAPHYSNCYKNV